MKKKTFFKALVLVAAGAACVYKRDAIKSIAKGISDSLRDNALEDHTPDVKQILSEEVPVDSEIVNNLTEAATQIIEDVTNSTGEKITAKVFSNMASHPESGRLEIPMDNLSQKGVDALKSAASKVMGEDGDVINNTLCFG